MDAETADQRPALRATVGSSTSAPDIDQPADQIVLADNCSGPGLMA